MKKLYQTIKQNLLQRILLYSLPLLLLIFKIQIYDRHRLDPWFGRTGLIEHTVKLEFLSYLLFMVLLFLTVITYQKYLLNGDRLTSAIRFSLKKGLRLMFSTVLYFLLFLFVMSSIGLFLIPLGGAFSVILNMAMTVLVGFSLIVHLFAKMDSTEQYKNPFNVLMGIKYETFKELVILVLIYGLASTGVSMVFDGLLPFKYTVIKNSHLAIITHGLTFLLLIAVLNYGMLYYRNSRTEWNKS
ncbi:MAG: hypothetical protein JW702_02015 [Clostridiales bacterium]|nr:hypothetical protein [Clostridiales bacterium]